MCYHSNLRFFQGLFCPGKSSSTTVPLRFSGISLSPTARSESIVSMAANVPLPRHPHRFGSVYFPISHFRVSCHLVARATTCTPATLWLGLRFHTKKKKLKRRRSACIIKTFAHISKLSFSAHTRPATGKLLHCWSTIYYCSPGQSLASHLIS